MFKHRSLIATGSVASAPQLRIVGGLLPCGDELPTRFAGQGTNRHAESPIHYLTASRARQGAAERSFPALDGRPDQGTLPAVCWPVWQMTNELPPG